MIVELKIFRREVKLREKLGNIIGNNTLRAKKNKSVEIKQRQTKISSDIETNKDKQRHVYEIK